MQVGGREYFIDNLLVRIHFIIVMVRWTGPAQWEFEFPFPGWGAGAGRAAMQRTLGDTFFFITLKPRVE